DRCSPQNLSGVHTSTDSVKLGIVGKPSPTSWRQATDTTDCIENICCISCSRSPFFYIASRIKSWTSSEQCCLSHHRVNYSSRNQLNGIISKHPVVLSCLRTFIFTWN